LADGFFADPSRVIRFKVQIKSCRLRLQTVVSFRSRQWAVADGFFADPFKVIRFKVQASKLEQPMPGKPVTATLQGCTESMYSFYTGINE
jgi:hypothetical protein